MMDYKWSVGFGVFIVTCLVLVGSVGAVDIDDCGVLNISGETYVLTKDVSTKGTCFVIGADGVTLDGNGYTINGDDGVSDYGVYASGRINVTLKNLDIADFGYGVMFQNSVNNSLIENSSVYSSSLNGMYLNINNNVVSECRVTSNIAGGIAIDGSNNIIRNSIFESNGAPGLQISSGSNNELLNNTLNDNGASIGMASLIIHSANNRVINGSILYSPLNAIYLAISSGYTPINNSFTNVVISNTNAKYYDIKFATAGIDGTTFIDMPHIGNYSFAAGGNKIIVKDSNFGEVRFLQSVNGSGTNLSNDIRIGNNSATVRSDLNSGLNKSANVTFYNLQTNFRGPSIFRDGVACPSSLYYNFTSLNAGTVIFNVSYWTNYSVNGNFYPTVTLLSPAGASTTTDRTPTFNWTGTDAEGDAITYEFNISLIAGVGSTCTDSLARGLMLADSNHTLPIDLSCFYNNGGTYGNYYNWSVRANDSYGFGPWSSRIINITALVAISMVNNNINFGSLIPNVSVNTTNPSYTPFVVENQGNSLANISLSATNLWTSVSNPSKYFQFKADNYTTHEGAFNWLSSLIDWTNLSSTSVVGISELNFTAKNRSEVDILAWVPPGEFASDRSSTVTFTASLTEGM